MGTTSSIISHPYFASVDIDALKALKLKCPFTITKIPNKTAAIQEKYIGLPKFDPYISGSQSLFQGF